MYSFFKYTLATANDKEPLHNKSLVVLYHFYLTLLLEEKVYVCRTCHNTKNN
ncbi:hypothetical protein ACR66_03860 [Staphylococcus aureus]|uniref:Uncharacterized protein n=2 Tax=Staphylococcus aureus TaxID=1280 RepID=Q2FZB5_STAA8|nr:hypothetical protein SAOUHSC_A01079 [Staphylococcus aureus subsp. aureus NCTC 8325]AJC28430.1 hypothetical protein RM29_05685 [Staphylococcus aureus]EFB99638.1 conserved hypothetical protein [Staphylococcus aureus A9765]EFU27229.1 hypothetical protein CGSSa01_03930 [Staphylococcus aureus subsp. aureus CGS01]KKJ47889.1 hypothetical protein T651_04530 [Staphylococcus aureus MRSN 2761]KKJ58626.1 hypothetical protein T647_03665 [Staphylococcus aureus MRSN 8613]KKJ60171.1 hypothetical protein T